MNELEGETVGRGQVPLFCIKYKKATSMFAKNDSQVRLIFYAIYPHL
jgi:hypothetical protein